MGQPVSDGQVAEHLPYIKEQAERFSRLQVPLCEYDDLVQVGSIKVFELLRDAKPVTHLSIINAMRDELRAQAPHRGGLTQVSEDTNPEVIAWDDLDDDALVLGSF